MLAKLPPSHGDSKCFQEGRIRNMKKHLKMLRQNLVAGGHCRVSGVDFL